ncbi:MAG TPA: metalloregulator ArsR/SmtB family transcription factor [Caulobacteraceae bacterium]
MPDNDFAVLLGFFKAMGNESRLRIVGLLATGERSGQELAELLDLKEPTISHHIGVLRRIGLVTARAEGVTHWYALQPQTLTDLNRALFDQRAIAAIAAPARSFDEKVLSAFVGDDGALKQIPASRRKRRIILEWLVDQFVEDRRYAESEVNEQLQRRHWDSATLRRELIGYGMMAREAGQYWRQPREAWLAK